MRHFLKTKFINNSYISPYEKLADLIAQEIDPERIITDPQLCLTLGTDASLYRLVPKIVLRVDNKQEVKLVMKQCRTLNIPYTFRAAGTSLSGQAVTDSVLIMLTEQWCEYKISENGHKIKLQPGIIGGHANRYLLPYGRKIGPDPASIDSCKIGGIAANNSSGMCCGTTENTYQTLSSMTLILADGTELNTADLVSVEKFRNSHHDFLNELSLLAKETKSNNQLADLITHKYRLKNTMGFSINALIDFIDPIEILQHLLIGSEGCLGFIADITYKTIIESEYKATGLYVFKDIYDACNAVTALSKLDINAVELIDGPALRSLAGKKELLSFIDNLDLNATALLVECHAENESDLTVKIDQLSLTIDHYQSIESIPFTTDTRISNDLWFLRKGLIPTIGATRKKGTSIIIEDISFPLEQLADGTLALSKLFEKHNYPDAFIFGHALVGNLHFVVTNNFNIQAEVDQYEQFMAELSDLVAIEYKGSLKSEHGTGRNMAPYVELEWGHSAYALMQKIKNLFDPDALLNPGVVLNVDKKIHIKDLKILPEADDIIDRCIECGFCESVCPSRNLSLTPRQRIVMFRQLQDLLRQPQTQSVKARVIHMTKHFDYLGVETCAATGLCADQCPVGINTGDLIRNLRAKTIKNSSSNQTIAKWTAVHFKATTTLLRAALRLNTLIQFVIPNSLIDKIGQFIHQISAKKLPLWHSDYPRAARKVDFKETQRLVQNNSRSSTVKKAVYLPSCTSRAMSSTAKSSDQRSVSEVAYNLLDKAGFEVIEISKVDDQCCGLAYDSQGLSEIGQRKSDDLHACLWEASEQGRWPVLMDASPCAKFSTDHFNNSNKQPMSVYEPFEFVTRYLLAHLTIVPTDETIMLHITCSSRRRGLSDTLLSLAKQCSREVIVPEKIDCCGWAGNKGFTTPELNQSALSTLSSQVPEGCTRGFTNSLTCEIGLSHHSGIGYQSILYLLDEVSS